MGVTFFDEIDRIEKAAWESLNPIKCPICESIMEAKSSGIWKCSCGKIILQASKKDVDIFENI